LCCRQRLSDWNYTHLLPVCANQSYLRHVDFLVYS
jgi:hypothetical protein